MGNWNEGVSTALSYIEENLAGDIDVNEVAAKAYVSTFYFQRIFHALCGYTLGEYIRNRRLTLAAQELHATNVKVINVALKYGYDSPDSFTRAFTRFHGLTPSEAKEPGCRLNSFAPLKIKLTLEGGSMLEYKILEKAQFTVTGKSKRFIEDSAYNEIPKFWQEHMESGDANDICGTYGICYDMGGKEFGYLIADDYLPWKEMSKEYETKVIAAGTWAVFPCRGELPKALQDVNTKIWSEWLPACKEYKLVGDYNIEMYAPPCENVEDNYSEIWIPVEKVK